MKSAMLKPMLSRISYLIILVLSMATVHGQEVWTLDRCIEYAIENSLSVKEASVNRDAAGIDEKMASQLRYPSVSGSTGYNLSLGRQVDPTTNDFINQRFANQGISISAGATLFNGSRITNQIKQAQLGKEAAQLDLEQIKNDLALDVSLAFIQILFSQENLNNAQKSLDLINSQIEQMDRQIDVGTRPKNARLDLVAQAAQSEQLVVAAQNDIDIAYLSLKQLLQLEDSYEMTIEAPDIALPTEYETEAVKTGEVYGQALAWQPSIKAGELRKRNAELGVAISRSNLLPSLGIGGSLNTNWSSQFQQFVDGGTELMTQEFILNGEPVTVQFESPVTNRVDVKYLDQLNQNLGYGFGLQVNVPIYSRGQNKGTLDLAKLEVVRSDIANQQVKNQLRTDVQRAVTDVKAAKKTYEAAMRTAEARRAAYQDTEKRFNLGVSNSFEFISAQNERDQAEVNLIIAKYDYIFKSKVLDYYQGKRITLD
ncbi:MAG: TolC family protein [Saprospiraceae bacterium]|nr:TolC family protein [Saprospiraceae bacterium]